MCFQHCHERSGFGDRTSLLKAAILHLAQLPLSQQLLQLLRGSREERKEPQEKTFSPEPPPFLKAQASMEVGLWSPNTWPLLQPSLWGSNSAAFLEGTWFSGSPDGKDRIYPGWEQPSWGRAVRTPAM